MLEKPGWEAVAKRAIEADRRIWSVEGFWLQVVDGDELPDGIFQSLDAAV
jgi:hypothetical protein